MSTNSTYNGSNVASFDDDSDVTFVAVAIGMETEWVVRELQLTDSEDANGPESLERLMAALRNIRSEGALVCLVCIDDDWSAIIRPTPGGAKLLISDATAALDYPLAADMLDELDVDAPTEEEAENTDEPWPEGDFDLLDDMGSSEQVLSVIFDDDELYASEQVLRVAEELGFAEQLAEEIGLELDF